MHSNYSDGIIIQTVNIYAISLHINIYIFVKLPETNSYLMPSARTSKMTTICIRSSNNRMIVFILYSIVIREHITKLSDTYASESVTGI